MNLVINNDTILDDLTLNDQELVVSFASEIDDNRLVNCLQRLCDLDEQYYADHNALSPLMIDLKGMSVDKLAVVMKMAMSRPSLINSRLVLNVNLLINGYNTLDDSLFESESVYVNDLEQLLDLKLELFNEIKNIQTEVTKWYLASLKSAYKVEYTYLDTIVKMPMLYRCILTTSSVLTLSQIMSKSSGIDFDNLPIVENAYPIVAEVISNSQVANELLQALTTH